MACACDGLLGDMPIEILVFILNGYASGLWGRRGVYARDEDFGHHIHESDDHRCGAAAGKTDAVCDTVRCSRRPLLDPRWRFAARATCRLWRDIIHHPSHTDAVVLGAYDPLLRSLPRGKSLRATWVSGRVVCASAAADFVRMRAHAWAHTPGAAVAWCMNETNATRKQAAVALVASGVSWAVDHVIRIQWAAMTFSDVLTRSLHGRKDDLFQSMLYQSVYKDHTTREVDYRDGEDHPSTLAATLVAISLRRGSYADFGKLCEALGHIPRPISAALHAVKGNRPDMLATLLHNRPDVATEPRLWCAAAVAVDPTCFARLLDSSSCGPPLSSSRDAPLAEWLAGAVCADRHDIVALCDSKGIDFDHKHVFSLAALHGSTGVMKYLMPAIRSSMSHDILHTFALSAMGRRRRSFSDDNARGIACLADMFGYAPRRDTDDMRQLVDCACATGGAARRTVYMAERWGFLFAALPRESIRAAFAKCSAHAHHNPIRMTGRLAMVLDRAHACDADPAASIKKLGLWDALVGRLDMGGRGPATMDTLFIRALCDLYVGRAPSAIDVAPVSAFCGRMCAQIVTGGDDKDDNVKARNGGSLVRRPDPFERALYRWYSPRPVRAVDLFPGGIAHEGRSLAARAHADHVLRDLANCGLLMID